MLRLLLGFAFATWATAAVAGPLVILVPGGSRGAPDDFLVRNAAAFRAAGFQTVILPESDQVAARASRESVAGREFFIVGMSRGVMVTASALKRGAAPARFVLVAGDYGRARRIIGDPAGLPPGLIVHHEKDACDKSPASAAPGFAKWSGGRMRVVIIATRGTPSGDVCASRHAHGFYSRDAEPIGHIIGFLKE